MVLQRDKPVQVWGWASPGKDVTVSFAGQSKSAKAAEDGKWSVTLSPLKLSATGASMTIAAEDQIILRNILVGDVWLCTGQSNMEYPLNRKLKNYAAPKKGDDESLAALGEQKPDAIRYIYVERTLNKIPELPTKGWIGGDDSTLGYVSAIGYFFAKEIYAETKVPIGIISSSWGGTRIEQWTPEWAYNNSSVFKDSLTGPNYKIDGMHPGQMYKGMIEPFVPFALKGVLWYQGESNAMVEDQSTYFEKFRLFAESWRSLFKDDKLPFYTVQIAPYLYSARKDAKKHAPELLPEFWEAQEQTLSIPHTGMVVTTDLVDNLKDIHPSYKWTVGHRLALTALANDYGKKIEYSGPVISKVKTDKNEVILKFSHAAGLASSDGQPLTWFTLSGSDGVFYPAAANIKGDKIIVTAPEVKSPAEVRFAWNESAQPNLVNKQGLPARPFRKKL